ncbi:hypothetical protein ACFPOI_60215 [Nonomuraea angiospora]|uniref:tRNA U54 and U55 pseudouridine synthase Pus10 n=1 Tax=Nonomuraea angiospora TaxID=46172 RepID=A0ABR9LPX6_9ACTN|nr:hypothetical protein [Nonomuraea angiospora]MBE1582711.1 tRNA U54 and U55 pseudouridine synthase Pus10 [Nonomuraea angiospora]
MRVARLHDELTETIRTEVNREFLTLVAGRVDIAARVRPATLLVVDPVTRAVTTTG